MSKCSRCGGADGAIAMETHLDAGTCIRELREGRVKLLADAERLTAEREEARAWVRRLLGENVTTCVYCGLAFPPGTPTHGADALSEHARVCEKHPVRAAEAEVAELQAKLAKAQREADNLFHYFGPLLEMVFTPAKNWAGIDHVIEGVTWTFSAQRAEGKTPTVRLLETTAERDDARTMLVAAEGEVTALRAKLAQMEGERDALADTMRDAVSASVDRLIERVGPMPRSALSDVEERDRALGVDMGRPLPRPAPVDLAAELEAARAQVAALEERLARMTRNRDDLAAALPRQPGDWAGYGL